jgi:radical SAM-linked protein
LIAAYNKGCKFDGWSDQFNWDLWLAAFSRENIDPAVFTDRVRDVSEPLPWDHIRNRVDKSFLWQEWEDALEGKLTGDCRHGSCNQCGTCDFDKIDVKTYQTFENQETPAGRIQSDGSIVYRSLCVYFAKLDAARFFSHLEMVNIFLRALKRAEIPVKFSQGFHPKPKISFDDPLPVGLESEQERFRLSVPDFVVPDMFAKQMNLHLPQGLEINGCRIISSAAECQSPQASTYRVTLRAGEFKRHNLGSYIQSADFSISLSNRKGKLKKVNLKDMVEGVELNDSKCLQVALTSQPGKTIRPEHILRHVFELTDDQIKQARVLKLKAEEQTAKGKAHRA